MRGKSGSDNWIRRGRDFILSILCQQMKIRIAKVLITKFYVASRICLHACFLALGSKKYCKRPPWLISRRYQRILIKPTVIKFDRPLYWDNRLLIATLFASFCMFALHFLRKLLVTLQQVKDCFSFYVLSCEDPILDIALVIKLQCAE